MAKVTKLSKPITDAYPFFLIMRHAKTAANEDSSARGEKIRGWTDFPIDQKGYAELQDIVERFKRKGVKPSIIFTSDTGRAVKSAKFIGKALGCTRIHPTYKLRSWGLGILEGKPAAENKVNQDHYQKHPTQRVPNGETFNEFVDRFEEFIQGLVRHLREKRDELPLVITHSKGMLALKAALTKGDRKKIPFHGAPTNARVFTVEMLPENKFRIRNFN